MKTLFYLLYPGDVEASRADLIRAGFPEEHLLNRDLRNRLRKAVGEAEDWSVSGPASGMLLSWQATPVGTIQISGDTFTFVPDMGGFAQVPRTITPASVSDWLQSAQEFYGDALAGIDVRRAVESRLRGLGAEDTEVPSLWEIDSAVFPMVRGTEEILRSCCTSESGGSIGFGFWEVRS